MNQNIHTLCKIVLSACELLHNIVNGTIFFWNHQLLFVMFIAINFYTYWSKTHANYLLFKQNIRVSFSLNENEILNELNDYWTATTPNLGKNILTLYNWKLLQLTIIIAKYVTTISLHILQLNCKCVDLNSFMFNYYKRVNNIFFPTYSY